MLEIKGDVLFPAVMNLGTAEVLCTVGTSAPLTPGSGPSPPGAENTPGVYCQLFWSVWGSPNMSAQHFWWQPEAFKIYVLLQFESGVINAVNTNAS